MINQTLLEQIKILTDEMLNKIFTNKTLDKELKKEKYRHRINENKYEDIDPKILDDIIKKVKKHLKPVFKK